MTRLLQRSAPRLALVGLVTVAFLVEQADAQSRRSSRRSSRPATGLTYPESGTGQFTTGSTDPVVAYVNERLTQSWKDNEIKPSPVASDAEWVRRVYLDIAGRIPTAEEAREFIADSDTAKRAKLIDKLLDSPDYVQHLTTTWTNLSIGRGNVRRVSRPGMAKFWREVFAKNRPWDEAIVELMTAEGYAMVTNDPDVPRPEGDDENGAINYWLAQMQMQDDMVQATAKTARLFLGMQVQCTQCHNHPFNDWKQDQFWQFNSFFRQMASRNVRRYDPESGRQVDWYSEVTWRNIDRAEVLFEKRSGELRVAYPAYLGKEIDPDPFKDRRKAFAELIVDGDAPMVAKAMVNRTWGQLFGYGFTKPVDDMGPHNPPVNPELFDRLTTEFVKGRYDVKQLVRWIANSEAYNLTSAFRDDASNEIDNPAAGESPLFSHMYVKSLTPEQLFDSLLAATEAHEAGRGGWEKAEQQRNQWMQQFVIAFNTDENDEATTFNGTIPQALMMMNGQLTKDAVSVKEGGLLRRALVENKTDSARAEYLFLATLSRYPTADEARKLDASFKLLQTDKQKITAYQDLFWALLNSNEFIFNH